MKRKHGASRLLFLSSLLPLFPHRTLLSACVLCVLVCLYLPLAFCDLTYLRHVLPYKIQVKILRLNIHNNLDVVNRCTLAKYAQYEPAKIGNNDIGLLGSCKLEK